MADYYIDKRIFVTGKRSVMFMDDPFNLTQYIIELIDAFGITAARNGLHLDTVLNINGLMTNVVELGGTLIEDTIVDGETFDLSFTNSNDLTLQANDFFYLETPAIASASNGWVLTLIDQVTGESEWQNSATVPAPSRNGLTTTGGFVELGGDLIHDTTINGGSGWNLNIIELFDMTLEVTNGFFLQVPTTTPAATGQVLTLTNIATWEARWEDLPSPTVNTNIYTTNGTLQGDRTILCNGKDLNFSGADIIRIDFASSFEVGVSSFINMTSSGTNSVSAGTHVTVKGTTEVRIETPTVTTTPGSLSIGDVLTLADTATGECEWGAPTATITKYVQTFIDTDWVIPSVIIPGSAFDITIPAATHGRGLNPIVQVQMSGSSLFGTPGGPLEAVVNTDQTLGLGAGSFFGQITIVTAGHLTLQPGDVILTNLAIYGLPFGKVIII